MKKFINIFMLLLCVCIVSCDDSNDNDAGLEIVKRDATATATGGDLTVTLSAEGDKVVSDQTWCTVSLSGKVVKATLEANTTLEGRTALVTVIKGANSLSFPITQPGNLIPAAEDNNIAFDAHGGIQRIHVSNSLPFTATPADSWLSAQVDGNTLVLTAQTNYTNNNLTTKVKLVSGSLESEITVTQSGIQLIPEKTTQVMYYAGDEVNIKVNSTLPFTAESDEGWLTVAYDESSLTLTATDNSGQPNRTATVTLTSETLTATIAVTQRVPIYADYIGGWTLTGYDSGTQFTYNLTIEQATANSTYALTGWGKSVVATDSKYALQANFDATGGYIYITAQQNIAVFSDDEGDYDVMFYGMIEYGGGVSYVTGSGYICYIGLLQRDGTVKWENGLVTIGGGAVYDVVGGMYRIRDRSDGKVYAFNVDSPFMRMPVMKKAVSSASTRSVLGFGKAKTFETSPFYVEN